MNKNEITEARFDRAAKEATRQFEDTLDLLADDGGKTMTAEEAYAEAVRDLRSLLFDYC